VPTIIIVGGVAVLGLVLFGAAVAILSGAGRANVDERLQEFVGPSGAVVAAAPSRIEGPDTADRIDRVIAGRGFAERIRIRIAKADVKLRVIEYIVLQLASAAAFGGAAYFLFGRSTILAVVGAIFGLFVPRFYLGFAARRRLRAFETQLSDTLNLWVNALRSGYSQLQGMEAIATELPPPISVEFGRVVQEVRLGLSVSQALGNMLRRVPSEDLDLIVPAVNIHREVGGNLAEILDIISFTIRERVRIKGEIRTLTAQGRISGWIITFLPVALALILFVINPEYMSQLWVRERPIILNVLPCGWIVMGICAVMTIIGAMAIQKIVDIEV
jgi:tight adherence protein B